MLFAFSPPDSLMHSKNFALTIWVKFQFTKLNCLSHRKTQIKKKTIWEIDGKLLPIFARVVLGPVIVLQNRLELKFKFVKSLCSMKLNFKYNENNFFVFICRIVKSEKLNKRFHKMTHFVHFDKQNRANLLFVCLLLVDSGLSKKTIY